MNYSNTYAGRGLVEASGTYLLTIPESPCSPPLLSILDIPGAYVDNLIPIDWFSITADVGDEGKVHGQGKPHQSTGGLGRVEPGKREANWEVSLLLPRLHLQGICLKHFYIMTGWTSITFL